MSLTLLSDFVILRSVSRLMSCSYMLSQESRGTERPRFSVTYTRSLASRFLLIFVSSHRDGLTPIRGPHQPVGRNMSKASLVGSQCRRAPSESIMDALSLLVDESGLHF